MHQILLNYWSVRLGRGRNQRPTVLGRWLEPADQLLPLLSARLVSFALCVPHRRTGAHAAEGGERSALGAGAGIVAGGRHCSLLLVL